MKCATCGVAVFDAEKHAAWHANLRSVLRAYEDWIDTLDGNGGPEYAGDDL